MDRDVEQFARLLEGDARSEEETAELGELAQLASALRDVPAEQPRPEFRARLRDRLLVEAAELLPAPGPTAPPREGFRARMSRWRRSVSVAVASVMSAGALTGVGVAAAAQSAQPDDVLYDVKRATESVRLALAGDRLAAGRLHLAFAERRLDEVEAGARQLPPDVLVDTLTAMDEHSLTGANLLLDHGESTGETEPLRELARFLNDQKSRLRALLPDLPVQVVPFAERSLRLVERLSGDTGAVLLPAEDTPTAGDNGTSSGATTEDGSTGGEETTGTADSSDTTTEPSEPAPGEDDPVASVSEEVGGTVDDLLNDPTVEESLPEAESPLPTGDATELLDDTTGTVEGTVDETLEDPTELPSLDG